MLPALSARRRETSASTEAMDSKFSGVISRLRNGEVELRLDGEHQVDHLQRAHAEIAQRASIGNGRGPPGPENLLAPGRSAARARAICAAMVSGARVMAEYRIDSPWPQCRWRAVTLTDMRLTLVPQPDFRDRSRRWRTEEQCWSPCEQATVVSSSDGERARAWRSRPSRREHAGDGRCARRAFQRGLRSHQSAAPARHHGARSPRRRGRRDSPRSPTSAIELGQACASTGMIYAMHRSRSPASCATEARAPALERLLRRLAAEQLLLASSTTEGQGGGNMRSSEAAVEHADESHPSRAARQRDLLRRLCRRHRHHRAARRRCQRFRSGAGGVPQE